jgi:hypothetical protein
MTLSGLLLEAFTVPVARRICPRTGEDLDYKALRQFLDGSESFMTGGHGITKARTGSHKRGVPEWANDPKQVQALIRTSFPNAYRTPAEQALGYKVSPYQRSCARRWAMVIHLYFVNKYSAKEVAQELTIPLMENQVRMIIRSIRRAVAGLRADGNPRIRTAPIRFDTEVMPLSY